MREWPAIVGFIDADSGSPYLAIRYIDIPTSGKRTRPQPELPTLAFCASQDEQTQQEIFHSSAAQSSWPFYYLHIVFWLQSCQSIAQRHLGGHRPDNARSFISGAAAVPRVIWSVPFVSTNCCDEASSLPPSHLSVVSFLWRVRKKARNRTDEVGHPSSCSRIAF